MIVTLNNDVELPAIKRQASHLGLDIYKISNTDKQVFFLQGAQKEHLSLFNHFSSVAHISFSSKPYPLVSSLDAKHTININGVTIGGTEITLMAGPCAVESFSQMMSIGAFVKEYGAKVLRASSFKPRTSPYSFQGLGEEGLKIHQEVGSAFGLLTETEVMDPRQVDLVSRYMDILRIGSRNMQNFDLLKEVGKANKPVILKRGLCASIKEWLLAAEYILKEGNNQVILCERGIRTYETSVRNTLDIGAIAVVKQETHLPVIVDPSHAAGRPDIISSFSRAAIAAGADGLLVECHYNRKEALCDGEQALLPQDLQKLVKECSVIASAMGRFL